MRSIQLFGKHIKFEVSMIKSQIEADASVVYVYSGNEPQYLYDYIDELCQAENGLTDEELYKFKVCYERDLSITLTKESSQGVKIKSIYQLLKALDGKSKCKIVVEELASDKDYKIARCQLAFIVQQLIYISYPLDLVDITLRKDESDTGKFERLFGSLEDCACSYESRIARLERLGQSIGRLEVSSDVVYKNKEKLLRDIKKALDSTVELKSQLRNVSNSQLKLAIIASKKAGKSVIVNGILGEEISPSSTELATANNCIFTASQDGSYRLHVGNEQVKRFVTGSDIKEEITRRFRVAQNDKINAFSLPDMMVEYVSDGNVFSPYTIYDTAGPDAAGTNHEKAAEKALQLCDVAVFVIDYAKHLTKSEEVYLRHVKDVFETQGKCNSLVFALNKFDVRYTDCDSAKSFVKSVDFLKTRLANISEDYRGCIIFPTSALEYLSAIATEKSGIKELASLSGVTNYELKRLKVIHKNVKALQWLYTHSGNLEYYSGIDKFTYEVFKKDSGMPDLLNYVTYIMKRKTCTEVVKNIMQNELNYDKLHDLEQKCLRLLRDVKNDRAESILNICSAKIAVGDVFPFGVYPQGINGEIRPIEWQVLQRDDEGLLVISKYIIDYKCYNNVKDDSTSWSQCSLRYWLNNHFLNFAFDKNERALIKHVHLTNPFSRLSSYITWGNDTDDMVFLLSDDEVLRLLAGADNRKCGATAYAKIKNKHHSGGGTLFWWLRSPGKNPRKAAYIYYGGCVSSIDANSGYIGVRPVLKLGV